jgi:hypothetical protein
MAAGPNRPGLQASSAIGLAILIPRAAFPDDYRSMAVAPDR